MTGTPYAYAVGDPVNGTDPSGLFGNPVGVWCSGGGTSQQCRFAQKQAKRVTGQECANGGDCGGAGCGAWAIDCWYPLAPIAFVLCIAGGCQSGAAAVAGSTLGGAACNALENDSGPVAGTGRIAAQSLTEQLAMESAQADPEAGSVLRSVVMNDSRWPAGEGWVKMQQVISNVVIHYNYNLNNGATADWKYK